RVDEVQGTRVPVDEQVIDDLVSDRTAPAAAADDRNRLRPDDRIQRLLLSDDGSCSSAHAHASHDLLRQAIPVGKGGTAGNFRTTCRYGRLSPERGVARRRP